MKTRKARALLQAAADHVADCLRQDHSAAWIIASLVDEHGARFRPNHNNTNLLRAGGIQVTCTWSTTDGLLDRWRERATLKLVEAALPPSLATYASETHKERRQRPHLARTPRRSSHPHRPRCAAWLRSRTQDGWLDAFRRRAANDASGIHAAAVATFADVYAATPGDPAIRRSGEDRPVAGPVVNGAHR